METDLLELFAPEELTSSAPVPRGPEHPTVWGGLTDHPIEVRRHSAAIGAWLSFPDCSLPEALPLGTAVECAYGVHRGLVRHIFGPFTVCGARYWNVVIESQDERMTNSSVLSGVRSAGHGSFITASGHFWRRTDVDVVPRGVFAPSALVDFPVGPGGRVASLHRGADVYSLEGCSGPWLLIKDAEGVETIVGYLSYAPTERPVSASTDEDTELCKRTEEALQNPFALKLLVEEIASISEGVRPILQKVVMTEDDLDRVSEMMAKLSVFDDAPITWPSAETSPKSIAVAISDRLDFDLTLDGNAFTVSFDDRNFQIESGGSDQSGRIEGYICGNDRFALTDVSKREAVATARLASIIKADRAKAAADESAYRKEQKRSLVKIKQIKRDLLSQKIEAFQAFVTQDQCEVLRRASEVSQACDASIEDLEAAENSLSGICAALHKKAIASFNTARESLECGSAEQGKQMAEALDLIEETQGEGDWDEYAALRTQLEAAVTRVEVLTFPGNIYASRDQQGTHGAISETGFHSDCGSGQDGHLEPLEKRHRHYMEKAKQRKPVGLSDLAKKWIPERFRKMIEIEHGFIIAPNYWHNLECTLAHREREAVHHATLMKALVILGERLPSKNEAFALLSEVLSEPPPFRSCRPDAYGKVADMVSQSLWAVVSTAMSTEINNAMLVVDGAGRLAFEDFEIVSIFGMKSWDAYKSALQRQLAVLGDPQIADRHKAMRRAINPEETLLDNCEPSEEEPEETELWEDDGTGDDESDDVDGE